MTTRQKTIFWCLQATHTMDFLLVILIDGLSQHMSSMKYRTILRYCLMILLFLIDEVCLVCRKTCLNTVGEHAIHCKELHNFKYKHDFVGDVFLIYSCGRKYISVKRRRLRTFLLIH